MPDRIESTEDARVGRSPVRHQYRVLSEQEKLQVSAIKDAGQDFLDTLPRETSRELSIARTKIEEAVMWAVKHVTA